MLAAATCLASHVNAACCRLTDAASWTGPARGAERHSQARAVSVVHSRLGAGRDWPVDWFVKQMVWGDSGEHGAVVTEITGFKE